MQKSIFKVDATSSRHRVCSQAEGYPYVEAEVRYACREHAVTVEDILSRRTRLAFLNAEAARDAVERVAEIMTEELGWSEEERARQLAHAQAKG